MAIERFANKASTTLVAGIAAGDRVLTVTSAALFPTSGQFRIIIENEILLVSAVAGPIFTVDRGQESTTATSHDAGVPVTSILTAAAVNKLKDDTPRPKKSYLPLVAGQQYATTTLYSTLGVLPSLNFADFGSENVTHTLKAVLAIPTGSTAQVRLYDVTNATTLWESSVISGPQTEYAISQVITPATGSSMLELWLATPTNTGGNASVLTAGILSEYS